MGLDHRPGLWARYVREIDRSESLADEKDVARQELIKGNAIRAFLGKASRGDVCVRLYDSKGRPRVQMVVDGDDVPGLDFLDESGEVVCSLPPRQG